ncbi:MAG: efflux RND transporter periplasmic adaptor subunit [Muribaculaceae bacterium]|nr:efflux RND transporter periplasmic adaptor subunit [Muribaculaceae bacterium]
MNLTRITLALATTVLCGCTHSHSENHEEENEAHHHEEGEIVVSPADAARYGIELEAARRGPVAQVVKVSGEVLPLSADKGVVSAPAAGIVSLAKGITEGSSVKAGQTLATVSAKDVSGGDANRVAKANLDAARRELERVTPLMKQGLVTKKDYNDALAAVAAAEATYSPRAASGSAKVKASGVVTRLNVADGEYVSAGQPIAEISASSGLTLRALLPASQSNFLSSITDAVITPHSGSPVRLSERGGRLVSASQAGGVATPGYIPVYFSFDGGAGIIPGTAVEVYLASAPKGNELSVPSQALYEQLGQMFVFIKTSDHAYEKRPVTAGRSDGERVIIEQGLSEGDSVVSAGVTFVRLAEQAAVVPEGHSHNH